MEIDKTKALIAALGEITSLLNGAISGGLKIVQNILTMGFGMAVKYHQESVAFAREVGLSAKQAQAYTEVLTTRAKNLGEKYGIAAEAVAQLERNLSRATGRVLMLTEAETERMVQINKLVGENTFGKFAEEIFGMGGQISTMQGAVTKAYATAAKTGLNASKMAEKIGQNLSMANRLSFKNGVDGLTRMAMLSEKFGMNMQSVESAANKFIDLQDAIETSAKLSMLGGAMGGLGGNPLDMSYEANNDPEALAERMTKMIAGYAQFNAQTGVSTISGPGMDFIRAFSQAMGISVDEVSRMAKKNAEVRYKNTNFGSQLDNLAKDENGRVDQNRRDFLLNKSQIVNGELMIADSRGNLNDMNYYQTNDKGKEEWKRMMEFNNLSDEELMSEAAKSLISIEELISGWITKFSGIMAEKIGPYIPKIKEFLGDLFRLIQPHFGQIADNIKRLMETVFTQETMKKIKSFADSAISFIMAFPKYLTSSWTKILGASFFMGVLGLLGWIVKLLSSIQATRALGGGGMPGGGVGAPAAGSSGWNRAAARAARNGSGWSASRMGSIYSRSRQLGYNPIKAATIAGKAAPKMARLLGGAASLGVGLAGMGVNMYGDHKVESGDWEAGGTAHKTTSTLGGALEYGALGAGIGSLIAPGIGTAVGGAIGAIGGAIKGYFDAEKKGEEERARDREESRAARRARAYGENQEPHYYLGGVVTGNDVSRDSRTIKATPGETIVPASTGANFLSAIGDIRKHLGISVGNNIIYNNTDNGVSTYSVANSRNVGDTIYSSNAQTNLSSLPLLNVTPKLVGITNLQDTQQSNLRALPSNITPKPVGGKEFVFIPNNNNTSSNINEKKEITLNLSGNLNLNAGNKTESLDLSALKRDPAFMEVIKSIFIDNRDEIRKAMASDVNGGRIMNDTAFVRSMPSQASHYNFTSFRG